MAPANRSMGPSTRALHADDALNVVSDVAPPMHVATTFRYSDNPDDLVPVADLSGVCLSLLDVVHPEPGTNSGAACSMTRRRQRTSTLG